MPTNNKYAIMATEDGKVGMLLRPGGWYETNQEELDQWLAKGREVINQRLEMVWDGEGEEGDRALAHYATLPTIVLAIIAADCTPGEEW